ncbi:MAG: ABC transporter ATP-binding protein [Thermodesulfovibrionales bacterium]|nr:ABC transporter ATP-binding protein [Thermodesulfovibrionales bacterium]
MIEIKSAEKVFRSNGSSFEALKDVTVSIAKGAFVSIVGQSGSGKSTLLSLIGGITPPSAGEVKVDAVPVYELSNEKLADYRREYIGFVFQQFHLIPYLTAGENVMLPLCVTGKKKMDTLAEGALRKVGLDHKSSRLPSQLSGGEQQRVAVARAIVNSPPIILADEPTGNLDTETGEEIFKLLEELNGEGHTIILVTHNLELANRTQKVIQLKDGRIVA